MTKISDPLVKSIRVKMTDKAGQVYWWTVRRVVRAWCSGGNMARGKHVTGWQYTDHEGCERFSEGNWRELVGNFRLTATNYDFTTNIS